MKKVYYLKTCDTCRKIMAEFDLNGWDLHEIKSNPISKKELAAMHKLSQSYEALFSRKSTQIKLRGINIKALQEDDFKNLILEHYTFLKRPVFLTDEEIFIGSDKDSVASLRIFFGK